MARRGKRLIPPATPLTMDLRSRIRRLVLGRCEPGQRLPSEAELAGQMKCSVASIRKALALLADEGMVLRRHGSGTYAGRGVPRQSGTTGVLFYGPPRIFIADRYIQQSYQGILTAADASGRNIHLLLAHSPKPFGLADEIRGRIDTSMLDSLICLEIFEHELMRDLAGWLPTVAMDFDCQQRGVSSCSLDHGQNMDVAVEHLWRLGHMQIGLAGALSRRHADPAIPARVSGYRQAMQRRNLPVDPDWVAAIGDGNEILGLLQRWQRTPRPLRPTALLCVGMFWNFAQAAVCLGIDVPRELSLVSHDREHSWLAHHENHPASTDQRFDVGLVATGRATDPMAPDLAPLRNMMPTALDLPFAAMGRWAVEEVSRRVRDPDSPPRHQTFTTGLFPGNSAGPATLPGG